MEDFNSKYTGEGVESILDSVGGKQDAISDLEAIRDGASKGATALQAEDIADFVTAEDLAAVATSGSYNDLQDKPNIPSAINIAGTNYTPDDSGIIDLNTAYLYRKPSGGIPKEDFSSEVQTSLRNADAYKGTVTGVKINGITKSSSNGVVDLGNIPTSIPTEVYVADFTMESLRNGLRKGDQVQCAMQELVAALSANKVILVRESEISDYKGVHVLNGYAEDFLYFSIVDTSGGILWCEGTNYTDGYIDGRTLHLESWPDKQDALKSGENIKTINGESIVGSGNIEISGGSGGGRNVTYVYDTNVDITLYPNEIVICNKVDSLTINGFERTPVSGEDKSYLYDEYTVIFGSPLKYAPSLPGTEPTPPLTLPSDVIWANGIIPEIENGTWYELSIVRHSSLSTSIYKAVLTPFKPVE